EGIADGHIDPFAVRSRTPEDAAHPRSRTYLRLPDHVPGIGIESVVNAALLPYTQNGLRSAAHRIGDLVGVRAEIIVGALGSGAAGVARVHTREVEHVAAALALVFGPGNELAPPFHFAGVHVHRDNRVDIVLRRLTSGRLSAVLN